MEEIACKQVSNNSDFAIFLSPRLKIIVKLLLNNYNNDKLSILPTVVIFTLRSLFLLICNNNGSQY